MIRMIHEVAQGVKPELRFLMDALSAIQEAAEMLLVQMFQGRVFSPYIATRVTVMLRDIELVFHLVDHHNFFLYKKPAEL